MAWVQGNTFGVRDDNTTAVNAIFVNSHTGYGGVDREWHEVNVVPLGVPADAKAVFLAGILIITHGTTEETADLTIALRAKGDALNPGNYIGQTTEPHVGGGQRSNMAAWVPLRDGKFEYYWTRSTQGQWPANSSYGINLSLQAYVR